MGRGPKLTALQIKEARERYQAGESAAAIGRSFAVSRSTVSRLLQKTSTVAELAMPKS